MDRVLVERRFAKDAIYAMSSRFILESRYENAAAYTRNVAAGLRNSLSLSLSVSTRRQVSENVSLLRNDINSALRRSTTD